MHIAWAADTISPEVNPLVQSYFKYIMDWLYWYKRIEMHCVNINWKGGKEKCVHKKKQFGKDGKITCKDCKATGVYCDFIHQGVSKVVNGKRVVEEFPKTCTKCGRTAIWRGRYQSRLGHDYIPREIRLFESAVPEEKVPNFLQDLRTFTGEWHDCDRYGQRDTTVQKMLNRAKKYQKLLGVGGTVKIIDMSKYPTKDYNRREKEHIFNQRVFLNVYPLFVVSDTSFPKSKTKREIF